MTLTTNGKDWLARNAGRNNCFTTSGVSYRDADGISRTGSTGDVVNALYTAYSVGKGSATIVAGTSYNGFRSTNGADLTMGDVGDAYDMESGSAQYCVGVAPTPTPTPTPDCTPGDKRCYGGNIQTCDDTVGWRTTTVCPHGCVTVGGVPRCKDAPTGCVPGTRRCNGDRVEECNTNREWVYVRTCAYGCSGAGICNAAPVAPGVPGGITETGPIEVIIKEGEPHAPGAPSVNLDTSKAFAYFKATPITYVGVMDIFVHNPSVYYAYFAWEMRMWKGKAGATCPTTTPELQTISRFLGEVSDKKVISVKMLGAHENAMIGGSFEIPAYFKGTYTLCLSLWGNYDKQALLDELLSDRGYEEEIPW